LETLTESLQTLGSNPFAPVGSLKNLHNYHLNGSPSKVESDRLQGTFCLETLNETLQT